MRWAAFMVGVAASGCAGGGASGDGPSTPTSTDKDAGASGADAAAAERPFAGSAGDATQLISLAIDKKTVEVGKCISDYRTRKHLEHQRVDISVGIDQEGHVLGVTSKGNKDNDLAACVQSALRGAPFPRSHAGVITVTRTYEELVQ